MTLNFLTMGAAGFAWGALSDRFGPRIVVLAGSVLLGTGMVLASRATSQAEFQVIYGVLIGVSAGSFFAPMISAASAWFERHRGLAVSLVSVGVGIAPMTMSPLAAWLLSVSDWRTAQMTLGILVWTLLIPASILVRRAPIASSKSSSPEGDERGDGREITVAEALRSPAFIVLAATFFACCAAHSGPIFHMIANALDHGVSAMAAATVLSAAGLASFTGRIVCGLIADRVGAKRTLLAGLALQALAVSLYLVAGELASFYAVALVFGFAYGGVMPLYAILVRDYFGARIMGTVFGAVASVSTLGMAIGPWVGGWLYDAFGGYFWLFLGSTGIALGAVAIALTFRPPRTIPAALARPSLVG
jgi:MFS family permease